jgi:hypothetical protein
MEEEAVEITTEEVRGIDANQIASMQLKDGTVVVVQGEEGAYEENDQEGEYQDQSNQLRARPMMVMGRAPLPPPPMHPRVVRPAVPLKPMVVPRGPVRAVVPPMGYRLRARPGMLPRPHVAPKPMVKPMMPGMPRPVVAPVPVLRPGVVPKPGFPVQPVVRPFPGKKPLVAQMVQAPVVYRARPGQQEEEDDYQEEEYAEEEYYEGDEEAQEEGAETQLRARPVFVPVGPPRPHHHHPPMTMKPKVVPVPVPVPVKRGPVLVPGVNTFQPRFRARPRPGVPIRPIVGPGGLPPKHLRPPVVRPQVVVPPPPKKYAYGFGPVPFRSRPRSASYDDNQEYADETEYQYTEGCEGSVCTKCGKEF